MQKHGEFWARFIKKMIKMILPS